MNGKAIEQARNPDLRGSMAAMRRAAKRARELAASTHTDLILAREGRVLKVKPEARVRSKA